MLNLFPFGEGFDASVGGQCLRITRPAFTRRLRGPLGTPEDFKTCAAVAP